MCSPCVTFSVVDLKSEVCEMLGINVSDPIRLTAKKTPCKSTLSNRVDEKVFVEENENEMVNIFI